MRRGWLAACLALATAAGTAAAGPVSTQASGTTGSWSAAAGLITGRGEHTATLLRNGNVLIAGGIGGGNTALARTELYYPATNRWASAAPMAPARYAHTATLLSNGKVLVVGGLAGPDPSLASSELYDPTTNAWSAAAPMIVSRARHTATLLADGRVLVVGGLRLTVQEGGLFPTLATDAEIYDPAANRWSTTGPMGFNRLDQSSTLLADGRVLVAGGRGAVATFNSTEIYDPVTNRWISAAPMGARRYVHAATRLSNGDVLVVGGKGDDPSAPLTSAEIYDPRTNLWVTVARMAAGHSDGTATLLGNGMVLVVGATGSSQPEVYDLARDVWFQTGASMDRNLHTASRLHDGKVLVVGGSPSASLDSVLLYDPNGVAPALRQLLDLRVIAEGLLIGLLLLCGVALFIPTVRQRLRNWRPHREPDEWIS